MRSVFLLFCMCLFCQWVYSQTDSSRVADTVQTLLHTSAAADSLHTDSVTAPPPLVLLNWQQDTVFNRFFINKNVPRNKQSVYAINAVRQPAQEDEQFYILAALFLFTGIIRAAFPKYFTTLFQSFLQSSQRLRHPRESTSQNLLPSLLMNIVFVLSGGLLLASFINEDAFSSHLAFSLLWLYCCAFLAVVYIVKALFIKLLGWSFAVQEPANNYTNIVFVVNKIAGLCFLPLLLILTYSTDASHTIVSTLALALIAILLLYRYVVSLNIVGKNLKINPLHFFLYLCAVEILPLLITYKVLLITKELQLQY